MTLPALTQETERLSGHTAEKAGAAVMAEIDSADFNAGVIPAPSLPPSSQRLARGGPRGCGISRAVVTLSRKGWPGRRD